MKQKPLEVTLDVDPCTLFMACLGCPEYKNEKDCKTKLAKRGVVITIKGTEDSDE